eukprot:1161296-Pelagomonas_calceolata.AAC.5
MEAHNNTGKLLCLSYIIFTLPALEMCDVSPLCMQCVAMKKDEDNHVGIKRPLGPVKETDKDNYIGRPPPPDQ